MPLEVAVPVAWITLTTSSPQSMHDSLVREVRERFGELVELRLPSRATVIRHRAAVYFGSAQNVSPLTFTCVWGLSPIAMQAIAFEPDCLLTSFCVALVEPQSTTFLLLSMQAPTFALVPPQPAARAIAAPTPHASRRKCPRRAFMCETPSRLWPSGEILAHSAHVHRHREAVVQRLESDEARAAAERLAEPRR